MSSTPLNAICLVLDHWHSGFCGCYGNAWLGTPHLDHLAADSLVADLMLVDSLDLEQRYQSWWLGSHAAVAENRRARWSNLPRRLQDAGVEAVLWSDDPVVLQHPQADFSERLLVQRPRSDRPVAQIEESALGQFLAEVTSDFDELREPFLGWIHSGSLGQIWDAPLELRNRLVDEDESPPPTGVEVPNAKLADDVDPDWVLGWRRAYAGQMLQLDQLLGAWLEDIAGRAWAERTLLLVMSARGLALGEHGLLGPTGDPPHNELLQTPFLLRLPQQRTRVMRTGALLEPADVCATLGDWWNLSSEGSARWGRSVLSLVDNPLAVPHDRSAVLSAGWTAVRTEAWSYWEPRPLGPSQGSPPRLYAKPDDRWEANEVADRCPGEVAALATLTQNFFEAAAADSPEALDPLPANIIENWR